MRDRDTSPGDAAGPRPSRDAVSGGPPDRPSETAGTAGSAVDRVDPAPDAADGNGRALAPPDGATREAAGAEVAGALRQRDRQRAYRRRLRERGLREFRCQLDPEHHDTLRDVADRLRDGTFQGDAAFEASAPKRREFRWLGLGMIPGAILGAALVLVSSAGGLHEVNDLVPSLRGEVVRLEMERDQLERSLTAARREAARAAADQSAVKNALLALNLDIDVLKDRITAGGPARELGLATPPGPRLVPEAAEAGDTAGPKLPGPVALRPTHAIYEFRIGDSVESVAARFGVTPQDLEAANAVLRAPPWRYGDRIVVPARATPSE